MVLGHRTEKLICTFCIFSDFCVHIFRFLSQKLRHLHHLRHLRQNPCVMIASSASTASSVSKCVICDILRFLHHLRHLRQYFCAICVIWVICVTVSAPKSLFLRQTGSPNVSQHAFSMSHSLILSYIFSKYHHIFDSANNRRPLSSPGFDGIAKHNKKWDQLHA